MRKKNRNKIRNHPIDRKMYKDKYLLDKHLIEPENKITKPKMGKAGYIIGSLLILIFLLVIVYFFLR